jgi:hypothetical protein
MSDELNELHDHEDDELLDEEEVEAYCMTCREKVPMDNPQAIWTRRGAPGTRGTCPTCGTTVFRMGKTDAHAKIKRPEPVKVQESEGGRGRRKIETPVTYINYGVNDTEFAEILAEDLNRIGIRTWLAATEVEDVNWATGVHPALVECKNMVVILSALAIKATNVEEALQFFVDHNKPIYVVQLEDVEIPDALRRKQRFDLSGDDYKQQFRRLAGAITGG